ncbi:MAG: sarcosine oxidase subunit gamma [Pelagimonas sp.]
MHNLKPITPLGGATPRVDTVGAMTITEVVDCAMASVAARNDQGDAVKSALAGKVSLPDVGLSTMGSPYSAFWMGMDQWMITAPHESHELLAQEVKADVGDTASVVEQTDAWCRFDVAGQDLCEMFERLCNAPVRSMPAGAALRGTLEHLGVFLWRLEDTTMAVIAPRSSAGSLHHALIGAAKSIA